MKMYTEAEPYTQQLGGGRELLIWHSNKVVIHFKVIEKVWYPDCDHANLPHDRIIMDGSAKWDGCWDFTVGGDDHCVHFCDINECVAILQRIEYLRLNKLLENAE